MEAYGIIVIRFPILDDSIVGNTSNICNPKCVIPYPGNKNDGITLKVEKRSAGQMWDKIRLSEDDLKKQRKVETGNTTYW